MDTLRKNTITLKCLSLILSIGFSFSLLAEAGTSLFVYGNVQLKSAQGDLSNLNRGMDFDSGETIITGVNGRAQLQMKDGAIFDLKPDTEFLIEEYVYSPNTNTVTQAVNVKEDKGFYRLVRGGFRSISGLIGKKNKKNYRVKTPVATIGIRGTDYTVNLCETNCGELGKGLYLSVAEGGVVLANDAGTLDIDFGNAAFVSGLTSAPVAISSTATASRSGDDAPEATFEKDAVDTAGNIISLENGNVIRNLAPQRPASGVSGRIAASVSGVLLSTVGTDANLEVGPNGTLRAFTADGNIYSQGSAGLNNQGFDQATGLYWGRWSNGTSTITNPDGDVTVQDFNDSSAHWVLTSNELTPVLPSSGIAEFSLVGNTNPTDNQSNTGVLGSASLSADFVTQTVDADVNLTIANRTWDAQANDVALDGDAATFAGDFDTVNITDNATGNESDGTGSLEGFFTSDEQGELDGAGLVYSLEDADGVEVDGAAAFELNNTKSP